MDKYKRLNIQIQRGTHNRRKSQMDNFECVTIFHPVVSQDIKRQENRSC